MKHYLLLGTALCALGTSLTANAQDNLPETLQSALSAAAKTQDAFVIRAVTNTAKHQYPDFIAQIDNYLLKQQVAQAPEPQKEEELAEIAPAAGNTDAPEAERNWKISVEAGAMLKTGNTDQEDFNIASTLEHEFEQWGNTFKVSASSNKENEARTSEEYRISDQLRYNLSKKDYVFGEVDYVNDRFSGYNYRVSELVGYGRKLIDSKDFTLKAEGSLGSRQSELNNGDTENTFLGKFGGNAIWQIREGVKLTQDLSVAVGSDATITISDTAIKTQLNDDLYLKFSFNVEHISDVPAGTENTDTTTSLNIGYEF